MDPNNNQPQGDDSALKKIEEDLKKLSSEAEANKQVTEASTITNSPEPLPTPVADTPKSETPSFTAPSETPSVTETTTVTTSVTPTTPAPPVSSTTPPESGKKGSPLLVVSIILVVIALLAAVAYIVGAAYVRNSSGGRKSCTLEAKLCPDGTSVGRSGPNCDFDACPAPSSTPIVEPTEGTPSASPNATNSGNLNTMPAESPISSPSGSSSSDAIPY